SIGRDVHTVGKQHFTCTRKGPACWREALMMGHSFLHPARHILDRPEALTVQQPEAAAHGLVLVKSSRFDEQEGRVHPAALKKVLGRTSTRE
ncbi:hypothetical protein VIGAN_01250800, partial [Vigna angularis var. angularis]